VSNNFIELDSGVRILLSPCTRIIDSNNSQITPQVGHVVNWKGYKGANGITATQMVCS
jgi:hypothetical protein